MRKDVYGDERHMLAAIIAEALHIADELDLPMVGISLNTALETLTGDGLPPDAACASVH